MAQVAATVLAQWCDGGPLTFDEAVEVILSGYIESIYQVVEREFPYKAQRELTIEQRRKIWDQRRAREVELASAYLHEFINRPDVAGKQLFKCEFADDCSYGSALEHGDLFRRLPHIRISNH